MKLNLGASRNWEKDGWHVLDHKIKETTGTKISGDIANIGLPDASCDLIFSSHVFEHIPHIKMQAVLAEINRVTKVGGGIRILVPDLKRVATAYVNGDDEFFKVCRREDQSMRGDLGLGGMLINFIVSPGQDTVLLSRDLKAFIAGYAHLYSYDFEMMRLLLERFGFGDVQQKRFCESDHPDFHEPLHVEGFASEWQDLNNEFYAKYNLVHRYANGTYEINFTVTGFDRDPLTSLIVEARKTRDFQATFENDMNGPLADNYNRYAFSLLEDPQFKERIDTLLSVSNLLDEPGFANDLRKLIARRR